MEIHSNILDYRHLHHALKEVGLNDVWIVGFEEKGSKSHKRKFKLYLRAEHVKGRRRPNNNSVSYSWDEWAPTYDEYGWWMAELFRIDPEAKIAFYKDAFDFHKQTKEAFINRRPGVCT